MRFILHILLLLCLPFSLIAQSEPDNQKYSNQIDTAGVNRLLKQAKKVMPDNKDSGSFYVKQALAASQQLSYDHGLGIAYQLLGALEAFKSRHYSAQVYYDRSIKYFQKLDDQDELAHSYTLSGINSGMARHSPEALTWFLKAMKIREELKDEAGMADLYYKIGLVYGQIENYKKALEYQNRSLSYALKKGDRRMLNTIYNNIGMTYGKMHDFPHALEALLKAKDSDHSPQSVKNQGDVFVNLGNVYREMGNYDSAAYYLGNSHLLYQKAGFLAGFVSSGTALAGLYVKFGKHDSAVALIDANIIGARSIGDNGLLYDNYVLLWTMHKNEGNYKAATDIIDSVMVYKDSINNTEKNELIEKVKLNYEMDKQEAAIKILKVDNRNKTQQLNILLFFSLAGALLIFIIFLSLYSIRKKNHLLQHQKKKLEELNQVKDKLFSVISHDLRGPVTSILAVLELFRSMEISDSEKKEIFEQLHTSTSATLETLDNLLVWGSSQLKVVTVAPESLQLHEMAERTIQLYQTGANHKSVTIHNLIDEHSKARFDKNQLEYILRNLVANAIKFSFPGQNIWIRSYERNGRMILEVEDQGTGMDEATRVSLFDPARNKRSKGTSGESGVGLGLLLIRDFLDKNGGRIVVESHPGKGAKFILDLPAS